MSVVDVITKLNKSDLETHFIEIVQANRVICTSTVFEYCIAKNKIKLNCWFIYLSAWNLLVTLSELRKYSTNAKAISTIVYSHIYNQKQIDVGVAVTLIKVDRHIGAAHTTTNHINESASRIRLGQVKGFHVCYGVVFWPVQVETIAIDIPIWNVDFKAEKKQHKY